MVQIIKYQFLESRFLGTTVKQPHCDGSANRCTGQSIMVASTCAGYLFMADTTDSHLAVLVESARLTKKRIPSCLPTG